MVQENAGASDASDSYKQSLMELTPSAGKADIESGSTAGQDFAQVPQECLCNTATAAQAGQQAPTEGSRRQVQYNRGNPSTTDLLIQPCIDHGHTMDWRRKGADHADARPTLADGFLYHGGTPPADWSISFSTRSA